MQLITFISAVAATVATVSADRSAIQLNQDCNTNKAHARIINRCDYPVNIWSVFKGDGCPANEMVTLKKGEIYKENLADPEGGIAGVSIKISKTTECKGNDIVQLEYFLQKQEIGFKFNFLDVSYVDCLGGDCPTRKEGYYLQSGNQTAGYASSAGNTWCPILACHDAVSCSKMSYVLPDDVQTKSCDLNQNMDFYMCGGDAPTDDDSSPASSAPISSKAASPTPAPKPSTTLIKAVSSSAAYNVNVAAVTNAPQVKDAVAKSPKVKTNVVYVTAYEYVNAKRHEHAHAHARRHQPFNA